MLIFFVCDIMIGLFFRVWIDEKEKYYVDFLWCDILVVFDIIWYCLGFYGVVFVGRVVCYLWF